MTDEPFDWKSNRSIAVREQPALAIYLNPYGQVVIRRERSWDEEDDCFIPIATENVLTVVGAILSAAGMDNIELTRCVGGNEHCGVYEDVEIPRPQRLANGSETVAPKDPTAAERQRRHRANKRRDSNRDSSVTATSAERDRLPLLMAE